MICSSFAIAREYTAPAYIAQGCGFFGALHGEQHPHKMWTAI